MMRRVRMGMRGKDHDDDDDDDNHACTPVRACRVTIGNALFWRSSELRCVEVEAVSLAREVANKTKEGPSRRYFVGERGLTTAGNVTSMSCDEGISLSSSSAA
jgi:hypothetical protein